MAVRNLCNCNIPRFFSISHSSCSTFLFSHFLSNNIPPSTTSHLSSSLLFSIGCSTLCSPKHPFACSSTFASNIDNGYPRFNDFPFHTHAYFCTYTYTPYSGRPRATSEQVSQIMALIHENVDDLGSKLNNMNLSLSGTSVVEIFQTLASERVSALKFFNWLKVSDPDLCCDPDIACLFVNNCGLLGNYEAMVPVLSEFSLKRVFLGMKAFGFLLDLGLDKASSMEECVKKVMAVFNEVGGVYPSCGAQLLIEMFGLSGSFETAGFVIGLAGRKVKHYHVLMKIMCKRGDCERVGDLVKEMKRSGCDMDASTYNLLLSCLCKNGKIDESWQVLEAMEKNCLTDMHSFDILINFLCKRCQFDLVLKLLDKMTLKGIEPSILTHAAVIKSYFESGKYEEAHEYVIGSASKLSYSSNANYSLLATLHLKNGNLLLACKVLLEMMDKGLKPNFSVYKKIMKHLEKKHEKDLSLELLRKYSSLVEK